MNSAPTSMFSAARLRAAFAKPLLPVVFFFAGVTYDTVTLTRIDRLQDNLVLLLYLSLLGALIVLTGRTDLARTGAPDILPDTRAVAAFVKRASPHYPYAIQFLFGGLFSAYTIFYSQSASLTGTAVFFAVLVAFLVANEMFKDRLTNLKLLVSLYALVCFSFFTFFLPVLTGFMHTLVFLVGAALSLAVTLRVVELIYAGVPNRSTRDIVLTGAPAVALIVVLVLFYFLHWIPPVPLSMKFAGVYHKIEKIEGRYRLSFEEGAWYQFWKRSDDPFRGAGPVHCFTAVFAPVALHTTIIHHWQYRPSGRSDRKFVTTDRIPMQIAGGRESGYRGYTVKGRLDPGEWRVDVETSEGRIIGRIGFHAAEASGEIGSLDAVEY
jgi:DUF2914 family protein